MTETEFDVLLIEDREEDYLLTRRMLSAMATSCQNSVCSFGVFNAGAVRSASAVGLAPLSGSFACSTSPSMKGAVARSKTVQFTWT